MGRIRSSPDVILKSYSLFDKFSWSLVDGLIFARKGGEKESSESAIDVLGDC